MEKIDSIGVIVVRKIENVDYVEYSSFLEMVDSMNQIANQCISENEKLKAEIHRTKGECGGNETKNDDIPEHIQQAEKWGRMFSKGLSDGIEITDRIKELEDQHQQDCIRINDLTTTISVLSSLYANLRKNVGVD